MRFKLKPDNRYPDKSELIEDIKRVARLLNKDTISSMEYNEHGRWNVATPIRHFGQWNKALEASGLKVLKRMNISDAELFDNLKKIWINKGRQPYISDVIKPYSQFDSSVYKRRFGNWRKALEAFVLNINRDSIEDFDNIFETNDSVQLDIDKKRNANLRLRFLVMKRDNFKCVKCGRSPATDSSIVLHIDHITPWSKGGKTTFENLQTLCSDCNLGKSDLLLDY